MICKPWMLEMNSRFISTIELFVKWRSSKNPLLLVAKATVSESMLIVPSWDLLCVSDPPQHTEITQRMSSRTCTIRIYTNQLNLNNYIVCYDNFPKLGSTITP